MKTLAVLSAVSLLSMASAFCDHGTTLFPRSSSDPVKVATYNFDGMKGPLNWYGLDKKANVACAKGKNQSPINVITRTHPRANGTLDFNVQEYRDGADLLNLGSTLEVVANGTLGLNGKTYKLAQFHFHTPSEHRINDEHYPAEVHFVFEAEDKSLSVVGIPIEISRACNPLIREVFRHVGKVKEPGKVGKTGWLKFSGLKNHISKSPIYQYSGSLTTPPCTEGIAWNVVRKPLAIDVSTYRKIKKIMKFNSRYTQNPVGQINLLENAYNSIKEG